ncbi:SPOR domain-containing protein [Aquabacterium sp. A7-Y]|uniref:SPOR domain-containing protein n=1 Tax=Aquabacterium sp. A7-Y TaxID=1349605 RepID=UPI00223CE70A|nr:SPOR domain-containing protein [Aquabacterium sp. A7-Y]MCW7538871.1 SPOR domain-containing protein [Aquabacterium sp. A7-Y]
MKKQRGGFILGLIVGLLVGLALALGVALYVTKVPVPFVNKVPSRTAEQDAAEAERNRNWDPNAPLQGRNPVRPQASAPAAAEAPVPAASAALPPGLRSNSRAADSQRPSAAPPSSTRDPAAILSGQAPETRPAPASASASDSAAYFVQAGAYARVEEAEQQRAKLAMLGFAAKITEREQTGRTVYRVRLGPYDSQPEADGAKEKLASSGIESALVRVQR